MLTIRDTLLWYKRPDVRSAMVDGAARKEIGVRYGEQFGKRPDTLEYEGDVLQAAQNGATSFHASEELWLNARSIETGMTRDRINDLRTGWDLVLDVDFTNFEATKRITEALCRALEENGVMEFGVKFSGNKGFHIGVAWESFPSFFEGKPTAQQFPEFPRMIADYLVGTIDNPDNGYALSHAILPLLGQDAETHLKTVCAVCGRDRVKKELTKHFVCSRCGNTETRPADFAHDYISCAVCSSIVQTLVHDAERADECMCGATATTRAVDLKIDTQLIASRHLYRLEYSLHEKSGLVSLPIQREHILSFTRDEARPDRVAAFPSFWKRGTEQASLLLLRATAFGTPENAPKKLAEITWMEDAAPEEAFPPTIAKMLAGMTDGKKRGLFILTNFLSSVGWSSEMIEARLLEWNKKNSPSLREGMVHNHLRYHRKAVLPPNFDNAIYKDLGVLVHDELSQKVKNPVQYVRMMVKRVRPKT